MPRSLFYLLVIAALLASCRKEVKEYKATLEASCYDCIVQYAAGSDRGLRDTLAGSVNTVTGDTFVEVGRYDLVMHEEEAIFFPRLSHPPGLGLRRYHLACFRGHFAIVRYSGSEHRMRGDQSAGAIQVGLFVIPTKTLAAFVEQFLLGFEHGFQAIAHILVLESVQVRLPGVHPGAEYQRLPRVMMEAFIRASTMPPMASS